MTKINTIDMVYHIPSNHTLLPTNSGTLSNVIQPSNPTYLNSSNMNTAITQLVYTNNNKRYFDFNGTSRAIRSTATVSYTTYSNIQFDCDFILRTKKRHVLYCVGTGSSTANETISIFEVYINNTTNKIVVELGSKSFTTDYKFDINVEYNILVTVSMDRGLLVNINGESVSNFDYTLSKSAFMSIASGSYYHIIGNNIVSGSTSNPNVGLDGYMTNVYSSFGGMFIHRDHTDYTSNPYNKLLQFNMLNDGVDTTVNNNSKYDVVNKVGVDFNYTKEKAGFYKVDSPVWFGIENAYYVKFGLGINNSLDDVLLFSNNQYEIRLSGTYSDLKPEPKVVVNEYTKSALNFENGIIDQVGATVWDKEGAATVQSINKIFGENSFETKALGDSLSTTSKLITGGATPFTIEFNALIKDRYGFSNAYIGYPLLYKNNDGSGVDNGFGLEQTKGNKVRFIRLSPSNTFEVESYGYHNIHLNEIYKYTITYDGSALRWFINDKLDSVTGILNGFKSSNSRPFTFFERYASDDIRIGTKGIIDNINIHDGIATKVRDHDPYEEFLVVDLAFDGENNSTKIVDNAVKKHIDNFTLVYIPASIDTENYVINNMTSTHGIISSNFSIYPNSLDATSSTFKLSFNNNDSYISSIADFTFELWLNLNILTGYKCLYRNGANNIGIYIYMNKCVIYNDGVITYLSDAFIVNTWHHLAIVRKNGTIKVYVDGINNGSSFVLIHDLFGTGSTILSDNYNQPIYALCNEIIISARAKYTSNFIPSTQPLSTNKNITWINNGYVKLSTDQKFDGFSSLNVPINGHIKTNNAINMTNDETFTISFSFKFNSFNGSLFNALLTNNVANNGALPNRLQICHTRYNNINSIVVGYTSSNGSDGIVGINVLNTISPNIEYKLDIIFSKNKIDIYLNNKLDNTASILSNNEFDKIFSNGLMIGGFSWDSNSNNSLNGYIKNFKIYKGVAVIPESPVGKIQLDFDNNVTDKYNNSTWTNNGVTFDQVNSVKGYSAYFNGSESTYLLSTSNTNLNFENKNFTIEMDFKSTNVNREYGFLISTNHTSYSSVDTIQFAGYGSLRGLFFRKEGTVDISTYQKAVNNQYYNTNIKRYNDTFTITLNNVVIGQYNTLKSNTIDLSKLGTRIGGIGWGSGFNHSGYIDNFKSYKEDLVNLNAKFYNLISNYNQVQYTLGNSLILYYLNSATSFPISRYVYVLEDVLPCKDYVIEVKTILKKNNQSVCRISANTTSFSTATEDYFGYSFYMYDNIIKISKGGNGIEAWTDIKSATIPEHLIDDDFHILKISKIGNVFNLYIDDIMYIEATDNSYINVVSTICFGANNYQNTRSTIIQYVKMYAHDTGKEIYYREFKSKIDNVIDKPAVHLPLETNPTNIGFSALTINGVGSPTYTTVDGKKCIKFESGKYLTINSNNIFNLGTSSDFYIEFDFYPVKNRNGIFSNKSGWVAGTSYILHDTTIGFEYWNGSNSFWLRSTNALTLNTWNNVIFHRKDGVLSIVVNDSTPDTITFEYPLNFNLGDNGTTIGTYGTDSGSTQNVNTGYMSNFKMFVGTSEIPETYHDKKVLDLDFKPTGKSYLFKDNNNKCVIHPVNITQRDYQNSQYCCTFNGTNQYLELGKNDLFNFGLDDFVIEIIFKLNVVNKTNPLLANPLTITANRIFICVASNNKFQFGYGLSNGASNVIIDGGLADTNTIYNMKIIRSNNVIKLIVDDLVINELNVTDLLNLNFDNNTWIGRIMNADFLSGTIYSIKVLRNTTDLTLLEGEVAQTTSFDYKLINTETLDEQSIQSDNKTPDIEIERNETGVILTVDSQPISIPSDPTIIDGSSVELFTEYNDTIKTDLVVYDQKPTSPSTYVIPELDYSPIEVMDVDGIDSIDFIMYKDAGDHIIDGFTEGHPDAKFRIVNRYDNTVLLSGADTYYLNGINELYIQNYYVNLYELGIQYPLEDHKMVRGYITYYMSSSNQCVGSQYCVRLMRRMDGRIIGNYDFTGDYCTITNLDCNVAYDAILFDKTNRYESISMSNRIPRPVE